MLHGDISNQRGFVIGVRLEDCLLKLKNSGLKDKILNSMFGKFTRADLDKDVLSLMDYIYWDTDMTVMLVVDEINYTDSLKKLIDSLPFNQVCNIKNISEVTMQLNTGQLTYFVTNSTIEKSLVNSKYAVTSDELNNILKRRVKRFGD